ncbi:MAG: YbaN family protein [Pseudomonadota bacterium]
MVTATAQQFETPLSAKAQDTTSDARSGSQSASQAGVSCPLKSPKTAEALGKTSRALYYVGGLVCVGLGFIGAALPLLPTTPFLLLATFCFARSSPRLHAWLINHKQFGTLIENWRRHGAISPAAKRSALLVIAATPVISLLMGVSTMALACQVVVLSMSATFIATRPDGPTLEDEPQP